MRDERERASGIGVLVVAIAAAVAVLCGGGALLLAGALYFFRAAEVAQPAPLPPPAAQVQQAHADVLAIDSDGTLQWNEEPVNSLELRQRLDQLKQADGPPRSVIVRFDPAAPEAVRDEVLQLLQDRGVAFLVEERR